jgi:hypothetical protein
MNRIASRTLRASAALLFVLPLVSGFTYQTQPPKLSVSVPAGGSVHAQGIWASTSVSVTCNPNGTSVFSFATLTQAQDGRTVQAFSSHTDTCTGAAITVPFELFANPRVLRNGSALLEVDVFVNDGPSKTVTRTITLAAGTDSIVNSESTRIGATGTILSRVPVIVSLPLSLRCPASEGPASSFYVSLFQRNSSGVIHAGSGTVASSCNDKWSHHSAWITIQSGRWHAGPAWAVANDASRPVTIVMGGKP